MPDFAKTKLPRRIFALGLMFGLAAIVLLLVTSALAEHVAATERFER